MSRKSCKRKHYDTSVNPLNYVLNGMLPAKVAKQISDVIEKNQASLQAVSSGSTEFGDIDTLMAALNMAKALCMLGIGEEYAEQIALAHAAMQGLQQHRPATPAELDAISHGIDIHEAQLDDSRTTVSMMEGALRVVKREIRIKKQQRALEVA